MKNRFSLSIATVNGSGSQSANTIIAKTFFRMGLNVGAKNLFPSNIAGLPTWFSIRVDPRGYNSRRRRHEIVVAKNAETFEQDLASVTIGGFFFYSQDFRNVSISRTDVTAVPLPFRELTESASSSVKMRKLLSNMVYVGVLAELLKVETKILEQVVADQFTGKEEVLNSNLAVLAAARRYAQDNLATLHFPYSVESIDGRHATDLLIDGNTAAAIGAVVGGCTFFSWYPITPSSSLAENFESFASSLRPHSRDQKPYAVVQAEDELSAISMVIGAGWAGSRAMTATSGPGLSLMAEAAGLSYFAEIPAVVWDVQRAGPSTGLPTRTLQGDLTFAAQLSHGDTEHLVLLPANPEECFAYAQLALDLAEIYQTLVIVLSDLDLGMNLAPSPEFKVPQQPYRRGKVLTAAQLNEVEDFARYRDLDGDGIGYRTLPGTLHAKASYFTRGTGHTERATYSEDPEVFRDLLARLKIKIAGARRDLPQPVVHLPAKENATGNSAERIALCLYGSTNSITQEVTDELAKQGYQVGCIRIRALPLHDSLAEEFSKFSRVYVVEQNRDGQMHRLLKQSFSQICDRVASVTLYDGLPISAEFVVEEILKLERVRRGHEVTV